MHITIGQSSERKDSRRVKPINYLFLVSRFRPWKALPACSYTPNRLVMYERGT